MNYNNYKIAIIGLGYVGLPLAIEFAKKYRVIGFDIDQNRINELLNGIDKTLEVDSALLKSLQKNTNEKVSSGILFTDEIKELNTCNIFIVTVPTPTDKNNRPVLKPLISASETVAKSMSIGSLIIYESTVYPGVTEEICVPILEKESNFKFNKDFSVGYSPERINPGDKEHTISKILKVTSGSNDETANLVDELYKSIITAGTFKASSIKVAEAAKVIENSQRDINIAFVNELSKIFNLIGIDTNEVLDAAATKWNFIKFKPGLVGGHCIGVDPFYLAQKAQELGYHPEIILAGRRLNDSMGSYIATEVIKLMINKDIKIKKSNILILGFTFKENCPDIRNTRVIDIIKELNSYDLSLTVVDPWVNIDQFKTENKIEIFNQIPDHSKYDAIIICVSHNEFFKLNFNEYLNNKSVIYDVKGILDKILTDGRL
jgi:UDP-N-acetyl-D-galactosamine dehydrogenase